MLCREMVGGNTNLNPQNLCSCEDKVLPLEKRMRSNKINVLLVTWRCGIKEGPLALILLTANCTLGDRVTMLVKFKIRIIEPMTGL